LGPPTEPAADLTDSQVLRILEARGNASPQEGAENRNTTAVPLLSPEDTATRHALRDAVAKGAPVAFAVQLDWSLQPIDVTRVPTVDVFKAYTLYTAESRREGRSCHFLRLGFFKDAMSAKQVAVYVRSKFASAAVVPVTEPERAHANEGRIYGAVPGDAFQQQLDQALDSDNQSLWAEENDRPERPPPARSPSAGRKPAAAVKPGNGSEVTLEQSLEMLAAGESWNDPDSFNDTGVRHLNIVVEKRGTKRR
jgi:hypothetical protein